MDQRTIEQGPRNSLWLRTAAILATAGTAIVGVSCSSDGETTLAHKPAAVTTTVELSPEQKQVEDKLCAEKGVDNTTSMKKEFDLSKVGSQDAILPSFRTVENGKTIDATPGEVADTLMAENCVKPDLASVFDALWLQTTGYGGTGTYRKLDAGIFDAITERSDLFRKNKPEMLETVENLASVITADGGVVEVNDFNVIIGEAKMVTVERDVNGNAVQLITKDVATEGLFEGYQLRLNLEGDKTSFSKEQKKRMEEIANLILITKDGEIIVKQWIGTDGKTTFEEVVDQSDNTMPVDTNIDESDTTDNQNNGTGTTTATTPGNGTTGTTTGGGGTSPGTTNGPGTSGPGTTGAPTTTVWTGNPSTTTIVVTVPPTTTPHEVCIPPRVPAPTGGCKDPQPNVTTTIPQGY